MTDQAVSVVAALQFGSVTLSPQDARYLLAHQLERPESWVMAHGEQQLSAAAWQTYQAAIERISNGEPLPYVIGEHRFGEYDFLVTPDTLIPRPETEELVELANRFLVTHFPDPAHTPKVIDVGTGSGCIPITLSLKHQIPVLASDISASALLIAAENNRRLGSSVTFFQGDLLGPVRPNHPLFNLIVANLPYIAPSEKNVMGESVLAYEPHLALFSGDEGLDHISRLLLQARTRLRRPGAILLEFGYRQGERIYRLGQELYPDAEVDILRDFADHYRFLKIELK